MTRALALISLLVLAGCTEDSDATPTLLPGSPTMVPVGDPAGPAFRRAELVENPFTADASARAEGRVLYRQMNCAYCHGAEGNGGMGPNLVDTEWLFGDTHVDRFMSVYGGRARGMPSYGLLLPDESIWKIVAYIEQMGGAGEPRRAAGEAPGAVRRAQDPVGGRH